MHGIALLYFRQQKIAFVAVADMSRALAQFNPSTLKASYNVSTKKLQVVPWEPCQHCLIGTTPYKIYVSISGLQNECYCVGQWEGGEVYEFEFWKTDFDWASLVNGNHTLVSTGACVWEKTTEYSPGKKINIYRDACVEGDTPYNCERCNHDCDAEYLHSSYDFARTIIGVRRVYVAGEHLLRLSVYGIEYMKGPFGCSAQWEMQSGECCEADGSPTLIGERLLSGGTFDVSESPI